MSSDNGGITSLPVGHRALVRHYHRKAVTFFSGINKRSLSEPLQGRISEEQWDFIKNKVYKSDFLSSPSEAVRFAIALWMVLDSVDNPEQDSSIRNVVHRQLVEGIIREADRESEYLSLLQQSLLDPSRRSMVLEGISSHMASLDPESTTYLRLKELYDRNTPGLVR